MEQLPQEYYQLLEEIQSVDFVIVELTLYLDTHPDDYNALQQYNQFAAYSKKLKDNFESLFGPLEQGSLIKNTDYWSWSSSPWPWQV
ncbi:spore coat protein CotJB [Filobacillus milosensis]|uniref:Spore coat protein CotJB n=1 Tax=Filobacillus milosensis TaxID=94137 RepID=A0A4Y8ISN0_9BACI|nr:spore coat protein CotJB [Filobacillus milosensis]TFB23140.1 spore coat protein CotJB [Filobacillus milosensis]